MPEEEYTPQTQEAVSPEEAYGDREGPQAVPTSNEEWFNIMDTKMNEEVKMPPEEKEMLTIRFEEEREEYGESNKKKQGELEGGLTDTADKIFKKAEFQNNLAQLLGDQSLVGHNPTEKFPEHGDDLINIVNGNKEVIYDEGTPGYDLADGWKSMDEINQLVKSRQVDQGSIAGIKALVDDSVRTAENVKLGEDSEFNYQKEYDNIKNKVINVGDTKSLATDKIFGNRVFKDDLMSSIQMGTYKDLGLTDKQVQDLDPTPDGKISNSDAEAITSSVLSDPNLLKDYLADYYTKAMEQNWNNNLSPEVKRATAWGKPYIPQATKDTPGYTPQATRGGDIPIKGGMIRNGIFMPDKK